MNFYLYLPPNSAHPPGVIKGLLLGLIRWFHAQNTHHSDYSSWCGFFTATSFKSRVSLEWVCSTRMLKLRGQFKLLCGWHEVSCYIFLYIGLRGVSTMFLYWVLLVRVRVRVHFIVNSSILNAGMMCSKSVCNISYPLGCAFAAVRDKACANSLSGWSGPIGSLVSRNIARCRPVSRYLIFPTPGKQNPTAPYFSSTWLNGMTAML